MVLGIVRDRNVKWLKGEIIKVSFYMPFLKQKTELPLINPSSI